MKKFNSFQKKLEEEPKVKPEAHFAVDAVAKKIISGTDISPDEQSLIKTIFISLQDMDRDIVSILDAYEKMSVISPDELAIVASYFLISKQIGPDSGKLRDLVYKAEVPPEEAREVAESISIPENSRKLILSVYKKIFEYKTK